MIPSIGRGRASVMPNWMKNQPQQQAFLGGGGAVPPAAAPVNYPPQQQYQQQQHHIPPPQLHHQQQQFGGLVTFLPPQHQQQSQNTGGWVQTQTPDGKVYYSNALTGETTFEKPEQLKTEVERQLPNSPWKEYVREGKSYFVNSHTKESVWEEPMELTMHRERLRFLCAGEPPTRDMKSLAMYTAAQKALVDLVIDVDGSLAKKRNEEELAAAEQDEKQAEAISMRPRIELTEISGELQRADYALESSPETFLQMLDDWQVPQHATWEEAFQRGIAADARYASVRTLKERKQLVNERRSRAPPAPPVLLHPSQLLEARRLAFVAILQELEQNKQLGPRSTFSALLPVFQLRLNFDSSSTTLTDDAATYTQWFDQYIEQIRKQKLREQQEVEQKQEDAVHHAIAAQIPIDAERLSKEDLFERVVVPDVAVDLVKRFCGTFARRKQEQREEVIRAAENKIKLALQDGFRRAFATGALSIDIRWSEFRQDEDLRSKRAPYLNELLMPFAGKEQLVEKVFRQSRDEASDLVSEVCRVMQDTLPALSQFSRRSECASHPELVDDLKRLEDTHGRGIVDRALQDQARRFLRNKEKFFELLSRYVKEKRDGEWDKIEPLIADRTAYRDMGTDTARRAAFEEYMQVLERRPLMPTNRHHSHNRSRSPRRGGGAGVGSRW